jgi:endoglucanase
VKTQSRNSVRRDRSCRVLGVLACLTVAAAPAMPARAEISCARGVNLAGAEFGSVGGAYGTDYIYPSDETIRYFAEKGFTSIRLPFLWERLQPKLRQNFDREEAGRLAHAVRSIRGYGMSAVLDPHNYARYQGQMIGSEAVPVSAFSDFWMRLATMFRNEKDVAFGLMNEPYGISAQDWVGAANAATIAIRQTGARNLVLVPGTAWTGAHSWLGGDYGDANGVAMLQFADPANNYAYEVHQYLDADFSGKSTECSRAPDAMKALDDMAGWLRQNGKRGYLGEFAASSDSACVAALGQMVKSVENSADVWLGWSYWAGGEWWPADEPLNIQPTEKGDKPQMLALSRFFSEQSACNR